MTTVRLLRRFTLGTGVAARTGARALAILFALTVVAGQAAQAQTFQVIHTFSGGVDGALPQVGVTIDGAGNLYGTASAGGGGECNAFGVGGCGTVYKLQHRGSGWTLNILYSFTGGSDGANPVARVIFGPNGSLYGTTLEGGVGSGTVFNLRPFPTFCKTVICSWMETVLFSFHGDDGASPDGDLVFDQARNLYGTTSSGGHFGDGVVYQVTPSGVESVVHLFVSGDDGALPYGGVIFDSGKLYGITFVGGPGGLGTVYELTSMEGGWTERIIASFQDDGNGDKPRTGLFDQSGNLYGATVETEAGGGGTVFELTPSDGGWTLNTLYFLPVGPLNQQCGPLGPLTVRGPGNLYGTTYCNGAYGFGNVFKLTNVGGSLGIHLAA